MLQEIANVQAPMTSADRIRVKVSVIIPIYNAESTIARAIGCVLAQDFEDREIIAVDDGSTDGSARILESYGDRIKLIRQSNQGASAARNSGARSAIGEYLAFLDADDEWMPGKLRESVDALEGCPNAVVAYSDILSGDGRRISPMRGSPSLNDLLTQESSLLPSATVVRRWAFERCGGFSEEFKRGDFGEDTFMGLRLREQGEFFHIQQPLTVYHVGDSRAMLDKYPSGYRTLSRLVGARYGRKGRGVISIAHRWYASMLITVGMEHIKKGQVGIGLIQLSKAATVSPGCIVERISGRIKKKWV
jgi:glycosyltransferase involved in cell wall biosynthesis